MNVWENNPSHILKALYSGYEKNRLILFPFLFITLFKQRFISTITRPK